MQIKHLFLLASLLATFILGANNNPKSNTFPILLNTEEGPCDIPPPVNFHIEEVGTTWIKYSWTNVTTFAHRVRTYRASDNMLLNTVIAPSGANIAIAIPLPSATPCYGVINAIGTSGCNSPFEGVSEIRSTIIVDLLVDGLKVPSGGGVDCTLPAGGFCSFSTNPDVTTPFRVIKGEGLGEGDARNFGIEGPGSGEVTYHAYVDDSSNTKFEFRCNGSAPDCNGPDKLEIWDISEAPELKIGTFTTSAQGPQLNKLTFTLTQGISGYSVQRLTGPNELPTAPTKRFIRERDGNAPTSNQIASASPNPFSETLDVFLADPSAETIQLQLFNLSGQQVLQKQFAGGQGQYTLSTHGLSPGFYMLRIEADGAVQTLKVVKSE